MFQQWPKQLSISSWLLRAINRSAHYMKITRHKCRPNIKITFIASLEIKSKFIVNRTKNSSLAASHLEMMIDGVKHSLNPQDTALAVPFVFDKNEKATGYSSG